MRIKNLIYGFTLIFISLLVFVFGANFPDYIIRGKKLPGPKFFPFLVAYLLIIMGIYFIIRSLLKKDKIPEIKVIPFTKRGILRVISVIIGILFYSPMIDLIGFKLGTFLLSTILMTIFGVKIMKSALYSLILIIIIIFVFEKIFSIPFPQGIFPF